MKKYSIFALALVMGAMTLTSCEDAFGNFLDKQPSNELTKAEVLGNFTLLEENHNDTYNFLLHGANRVNNSWMDAATDQAIAGCTGLTAGVDVTGLEVVAVLVTLSALL